MIRPATTLDYNSILEINLEWEHFLAPLDMTRLKELRTLAEQLWVFDVANKVAAFILVFGEGSGYDSQNYRWFSQWFSQTNERFYYVDRIAIKESYQGRGIGRQLYSALFDMAAKEEISTICCEYNYFPLNVGSKHFHQSMGFEELGRQELDGGKVVSLQGRKIP